MTHLTETAWHGYETEPRLVKITIASELAASDITAAELRIEGLAAVPLTPQAATGGYALEADVVLPAAGIYRWAVEVTDDEGHTPIVVAIGSLRVDPRINVAAP